jgi:hypothetical protein
MEYKITNVQARDSFQTQYGEMQAFAIALEGETGWHALNQKLETPPPRVGDTIFGIITNETTKNGTPYKKFKKQNPKYADRAGTPTSGITGKQAEYIIQMLEELTGRRTVEDTVVDVPEEPLDDPFAGLGV